MNKNIFISELNKIYENNLCEKGKEIEFCNSSKIGQMKCCVMTNIPNVCCDVCIAKEIEYLNSIGIKTLNSCCGHGNKDLAFVLVENAEKEMEKLGYEKDPLFKSNGTNKSSWKSKTKFIYENEG